MLLDRVKAVNIARQLLLPTGLAVGGFIAVLLLLQVERFETRSARGIRFHNVHRSGRSGQ
jgi:hypothetical protein